ncbi:LuxR C-terminal-related transcriptional regulator [Agromyces sp. NPDC057679]|uniref:LuxR C-terminal-related transcriptional regulator n=1 Tax=Agromyces sp. NPDC057679 TaxID=3346207 RepID=UPI00366FAC70
MTGRSAYDAGLDALGARDWQQAATLLEEAAADEPSAAVLEALGTAYFWTDHAATIEVRERAYREYRSARDPYGAARVAIALAWDHVNFRNEESVAEGWLQLAGRALAGRQVAAEHGHLALWEADFALSDSNLGIAELKSAEALEIGRLLDDSDIELLARAQQGLVRLMRGEIEDGMRLLEATAVAALTGEISDPAYAGYACCYLITACQEVRDVGRAGEWCAKLDEHCRSAGYYALQQICRTEYAGVLVEQGDWDRADRELRVAAEILAARRPPLVTVPIVQLGELRRRQGRVAEAVELFGRGEGQPLAILGLGAIALDAGDAQEARRAAERYLRQHDPDDRIGRFRGLELLVLALVADGRSEEAEAPLRELQETVATLRDGVLVAAALHATAVVQFAQGDDEAARRAAEDAIVKSERAGAPLAATGSRALLERIDRATRGERTDRDRVITARESDVLRLVAEGMSNAQVAARLHLSEHTVHRHVANIMTKLEVATRAAAVAKAAARGLL